jgi:hypothetical protein
MFNSATHRPMPLQLRRSIQPFCRLTALVTAADSKYFLPLKNLVGSVKFHDNGTRIIVCVALDCCSSSSLAASRALLQV